jgi:hypothetical protein
MDIQVIIKVKDEYDQIHIGKSVTIGIDNDTLEIVQELDNVIQHVKNALISAGYTAEALKDFFIDKDSSESEE